MKFAAVTHKTAGIESTAPSTTRRRQPGQYGNMPRSKRAGTRLNLCSTLLVAAVAVGGSAQTTPLPSAGSQPGTLQAFGSGNATPLLSRYDPLASTQTDVLFGRNTAGPYQLSWKNAHVGTESVMRNDLVLHAGVDYTIDLTAGVINFTIPLSSAEVARVTYLCDTLGATPIASAQVVPLQWDIWQSGQNQLRFSTLYRLNTASSSTNAAAPPPSPTAYTALQFTGGSRLWTGTSATTGLFLDLQNNDWMRRGGWQVGTQTTQANNQLGLTYTRAGSLFAQTDASKIAAGRELLQATDKITPWHGVVIDFFARQTTLLTAAPNSSPDQPGADVDGTVTREAGGTVAVALPQGAKVSAGRTLTDSTPTQGDGTLTVKDNVSVASPIQKGTQVTVALDTQTNIPKTDGVAPDPTPTTYSQTTTIGIKSTPNKQVTVTGSFQNTLNGANPQDSNKLTVEAMPIPTLAKLKLTASEEDVYQKDGVIRNRSALLNLPPLTRSQLTLSGGVQQNSAPGHELNVGLINATAHPLRYLEFGGGARLRDGNLGANMPDPNAVNTYTASLAVTYLKKFKITGDVTRNPEATDGTVQRLDRQSLGLQADLGLIALRGQYGYENDYVNSRLNNTTDLSLDLRLSRYDTLTTGFKLQSLFDQSLSGQTSYQLGFTHHMGSLFDLTLSGMVTTYDQDVRVDPDRTELKAQAKLGLHF
jgi:hypothetical protein